MTKDQFAQVLDSLSAGWKNRDYPSVADHFHEQLFYSDPLNYSIRNRRDLLEFFTDDDGKPQSCVFHNAVLDEERQIGTAEYTYQGTYLYHGTVWIELKDDKIASWREYQHKSERTWKEFWNIDERDRS
jgi:hypothetical protein